MDPHAEPHDPITDAPWMPPATVPPATVTPAAPPTVRSAPPPPPPPPPPPSATTSAGFPPPAPAAHEGWTEIDVGGLVPAVVSRTPRRRRLVALGAAAAVLTGGLASVRLLRASSDASNTPSAAVEKFVHALEQRDLLAAADTFSKSDRALVAEAIDEMTKSPLQPAKDVDLHAVPGYTLAVSGLQTTAEQVTDDIAVVTLTAGHYRATADVREILRRLGLSGLVDHMSSDDLSPVAEGDLESRDEPLRVATVRDGEGWHVSFPYTAAELARREQDLPAPDPAQRIKAVGASSPEAAARELADSIVAADWRHGIELTPSDEAAVLHDYGALFGNAAKDVKPFGKIDALETHTKRIGKHTLVVVDKIALTWFATDDGSGGSATVERDGSGCFKLSMQSDGDVENTRACVDDLSRFFSKTKIGSDQVHKIIDALRTRFDDAGVYTIEHDGRWFVAPYHTLGSIGTAAYVGLIGTFARDIDTNADTVRR